MSLKKIAFGLGVAGGAAATVLLRRRAIALPTPVLATTSANTNIL
ncbi:MAG: hypothetical protein ACRD3H_01555 [Terriglobales bacterium]